MFRLITVLLLVAGLGLIVWGGNRYLEGPMGGETASLPAQDTAAPDQSQPVAASPARRSSGATDEDRAVPEGGFELMMDDDAFGTASATNPMLDRLRTVPIAHETPSEARFNRAFEVTVAIDATGDDTAADALPGEGNIVEGEAGILDKAQATLSGSAFDIELVSPSIQTVSPVTENVWRWRVTPVETGRHPLRIELFALENNEALPIRTFTDEVEVRVSRLGQVLATANTLDPVFMILGGAGSLLAGLFGVFRFFRGR